MTTDIHNLGQFTSLADVWAKYPNGAYTGDYVFINGVRYYWDKYEVQWLTRVDTIDLNIEVFDISTYDFVNYDWRESLPDGKYSVICEDKIIGTLLKAREGFVLEGFLSLYQGDKDVAVKHGDHKTDKSKVIIDITEKTYIYNAEDDVFFFSDGHISNETLLNTISLNKKTQDTFNASITGKLVQTNANVASNATKISEIKVKVGEPTDEASATGSAYARIAQNEKDIETNEQSITRLEEDVADKAVEISEIKDDISSHSDDINTLNNEVDNIKQSRGEADGYASLDSDGKVPIAELPTADGGKPGILKSGQEARIRRDYIGELFMELTSESDGNDVARAFTPKGESEPRVMQVGDRLSNYGDKYPRNLIVVSTGLDKTQTTEGGGLIYLADGNELYKMIVDTAQWKLYAPITAVDRRRIYKPSLMRLTKKSTAEEIQSALTPIGETQPVFPKAGDGAMDSNESVCVISNVSEWREDKCLIRILNAYSLVIIGISSDMAKVVDIENQDYIYADKVLDITNALDAKIGDLGTDVSKNTTAIGELQTTVADHEQGLNNLADSIYRVQENTLTKEEGAAITKTHKADITSISREISTLTKDVSDHLEDVVQSVDTNTDDIAKVNEKLDTSVVSGLSTARDGTNVFLKQTKRNIKTGKEDTSNIYLSAATTSNAGVMTATDKKKLGELDKGVADNKNDIEEVNNSLVGVAYSHLFTTDPSNESSYFKLDGGELLFYTEAAATVSFKLSRFTGRRYEEYPLWMPAGDGTEKQKTVTYTISVNTSNGWKEKDLNITYGDTTEPLQNFIINHSRVGEAHARKRWTIQAFNEDGLPLTPFFEIKVSERSESRIVDLGEGEVETCKVLTKKNGVRFIPRKQDTRLAFTYDSSLWDKVGDVEFGFRMQRLYDTYVGEASPRYGFYKIPVAGDIVRRGELKNKTLKAEGTVMYVDRNADGTFDMVWSEGKKVYTMTFSKYTYQADGKARDRTGMRITKAATLICDNITHQTKGGTLRDLYIQAGAKYNESTGYYELNGLTDITEEEMRVIYLYTNNWWTALPNMQGWLSANLCRTNIPCPNYQRLTYARDWNLGSICNGISSNPSKMEVINFDPIFGSEAFLSRFIKYIDWAAQGNYALKKIIGILDVSACTSINIGGYLLEDIQLKGARVNVSFYQTTKLSKDSLLYLINNSAPTSAITVSLLQALYDKYKNDADVVAALTEHPLVSLALKTN